MCPPFDATPEPDDKLVRLAAVFRKAAEKSTGPAKPKFVRLSNAFNAMQDLADRGDRLTFEGAKLEFDAAMDDVKRYARTNPSAQRILMELSRDILKIEGELPEDTRQPDPPVKPPQPPEKPPEKKTDGKKKGSRHWHI